MRYRVIHTTARLLATTGFVCAVAIQPAQAAIIDFESLANPGSGFYDVANSYSEDGFTLSVFDPVTLPFVTFGAGEVRYGGSPALYNNNIGGGTRLVRDGGGTFSISSIDLAGDTRFGPIPVTFVGTKDDATTVQLALILNNSLLQSFAFGAEFTNLVSLEWRQITPYHQFDNIQVVALSTPVPEPSMLLLLSVGLAYVCGRSRAAGRPALRPSTRGEPGGIGLT